MARPIQIGFSGALYHVTSRGNWQKNIFEDNTDRSVFLLSLTMTICFNCAVLAGNIVANILRNLWTFMIIFCGHFTTDAEVFYKSVLDNELPGHWYLRQLRGSSNLKGGKLFHILSGNLSHLIEHHLFPTVPARRCATMSVKVQKDCGKLGQNYNNDYLYKQFGQVVWRILRHSFPSSPKSLGT
jgi:linoleoyl-CoA desaturase